MEYYKQFTTHISNNDLPSTVSLWEEYCMSDEVDAEEVVAILEDIKASLLCDSFGVYVDQILPLWDKLPESDQKDRVFQLVIDIQTNNSAELADRVTLYLQEKYADCDEFANKLRLVGLREREAFRGAISHFVLLNHLQPHNFVFHTGGWGVGEIVDVSFIREEISLEFDYVAGLKDLSFKNAFKTLIPIAADHFLAKRFGDPDALEKEAKEDPVAVLKGLLKDLGPKTAAEIKDELCELVIPEEEWNKWWQAARAKLKKDTLIESPKSIKYAFKLRKSEVSHEQQLRKILDKKPDTNTLIETLHTFMRDFPSAFKNPEFKSTLIHQLSELVSQSKLTTVQSIQLQFFLSDLSGDESHENQVLEIIKGISNPVDIVVTMDVLALKKRFLSLYAKAHDDWQQVFANLFLTAHHNPVRDNVFQKLLSEGHTDLITAKVEEMLSHPQKYPPAFLWYFGKVINDKDVPLATGEGRLRFFETFFVLLFLLEQKGEHRDLVKKMYGQLTEKRYELVRDIFDGAPIEYVKEILLLATKCQCLSEHDIKILNSLAEVVHPALTSETSEESDEETIWTTEEGYLKIKERLHQIATVETVENAREIEVARAHGDLRENSEFKYALEKRDQLQSELKRLSSLVDVMRIITPDDIQTETVGVGTCVELENESGRTETYTFLGPWDTKPEENVLSFNSKLAQTFAGARIGEKRKMLNDTWIVKDIRSYLKS